VKEAVGVSVSVSVAVGVQVGAKVGVGGASVADGASVGVSEGVTVGISVGINAPLVPGAIVSALMRCGASGVAWLHPLNISRANSKIAVRRIRLFSRTCRSASLRSFCVVDRIAIALINFVQITISLYFIAILDNYITNGIGLAAFSG